MYVKELLKARIIAEAMTKSAISAAEDAGASDAVVGRLVGANEDAFLIAAINGLLTLRWATLSMRISSTIRWLNIQSQPR